MLSPRTAGLLVLWLSVIGAAGSTMAQEDAGAPEEPGYPADGGVAEEEDLTGDAGLTEDEAALFEDFPVEEIDPSFESVIRSRRPATKDSTGDDLVVDGDRLRNTSRASTLEALSQEDAGIYVTGRGAIHGVSSGATGGIYIRGLGGSPNSQVLVVEDGAPDYMGIFGHPIPDAYVPFLLEDALVVKGGDSVLYGTNAMGGVVVLRSRWREEDGLELQNDAAYGSYSTIRETVSALAKVGKLDLAGAFHAMSTDGHRDGAGGEEMIAQLAARYRFTPDLQLSVRDKVVHILGADPGPASHPNPDHTFDVWRNNLSLSLGWTGDRLRLTVTPFLNTGVHELYDGFRSEDYVTGGSLEAEIDVHETTDLLLGLAVQHVTGDVRDRITGEVEDVDPLTDLSAYGQVTFRPWEPLTLVAGARAMYSLAYDMVFLYKGGFNLDIYRGLFARGRVSRNFRQPTLRELYLPYPTANPDLQPEYSLNTDVGLGWAGEHLEIEVTGYRTEADDMIRYFGAWPAAEVVNIDHMVIWGLEGRVGLRDLGPVSVSVSGDTRDVGRYTRQNPRTKLNFSLEASEDFGPNTITGGITGELVRGLYMANYEREPMDDVFTMDLSLRYRRRLVTLDAVVEPYVFLRNLLDRRYAYVEDYPMPGFNVLAGLRLGFR